MATFVRKNAWSDNNGGRFRQPDGTPTDLYWYAKAVGVMMSRPLSDPTSWWFFAAIHGQYITNNDGSGQPPTGFPNWRNIPPVPNVPTSPLPSTSTMNQYWDQCQHGGWYFAPWHRGYLYALENILRIAVVQSGGPSTWALPYWNYLDSNSGQLQMPPALSAKNLPDGSLNPLFVTARYGVRGNGNIVILSPPVNQNCQQAPAYTNNYGGGVTGFAHFAGGTGALESNPHSIVHGQIGGNSNTTPYYGLMSDPGLAALDPVFYLHHCNIDRLWAHWNNSGHQNPTDANWLNGPTASGQRKFYMPKPDGSAWNYTPGMVNTISQLGYTYSDLPAQSSAKEYSVIKTRLLNLTKTLSKKSIMPVQLDDTAELVGASRKSVKLGSTGAQAPVKLDSKVNAKLKKSLVEASESRLPDDVFLLLEGIKGTADSNMYSVAVNQHYVGHFSLFGIRKASMNDGHHAGSGLHVKFDISSLVDELHLNAGLPEKLDVQIVPDGQLLKNGGKITIDRISVYRLPNK